MGQKRQMEFQCCEFMGCYYESVVLVFVNDDRKHSSVVLVDELALKEMKLFSWNSLRLAVIRVLIIYIYVLTICSGESGGVDLQEELSEHFVLAFKGLSSGDMKGFAG